MSNALTDSPLPSEPMPVAEYRRWVSNIEHIVSKQPHCVDRHTSGKAGFQTNHTLTPGLYLREIVMPAGALVVSRIHLKEHPFMILSGEVSVFDGNSSVRLKAPYRGITVAGTKRVLYVHEETTWITCHATNKETLEEIDENGVITCDTFEEYELCLG